MITAEKKQEIIAETIKYLTDTETSLEDLCEVSGVNKSYLSIMLKGGTEYYNGAEISETHFIRLAQAIDVDLDSEFWQKRNTLQFKEMFYRLKTAKTMPIHSMIIGQTGCGKTFTLSRFRKKYAKKTFVITLTGQHRVPDMLKDVCKAIRCEYKQSNASCIRSIAKRINNIADLDNMVLLAFDEAENATVGVIRAIKSLYDAVKSYCSIIMIGTDQLETRLALLEKKNSTGIPQFCSRFRSGVVYLEPIEKMSADKKEYLTFEEFFKDDITDPMLQTLLRSLCKDYRMLNWYVVNAKKKAKELGVPLTFDFFVTLNKINF